MSDAPASSGEARLILAHKQSTSARLRFLRFDHGVCAFTPFPPGARVCGDMPTPAVVTLPSVYLADAEKRLGLPVGGLKIVPEFRQCVEAGDACAPVHLATFTATDPPFEAVAAAGGRFIAITEARDCPQVDLVLLRTAYEIFLGG